MTGCLGTRFTGCLEMLDLVQKMFSPVSRKDPTRDSSNSVDSHDSGVILFTFKLPWIIFVTVGILFVTSLACVLHNCAWGFESSPKQIFGRKFKVEQSEITRSWLHPKIVTTIRDSDYNPWWWVLSMIQLWSVTLLPISPPKQFQSFRPFLIRCWIKPFYSSANQCFLNNLTALE